MKKIDRDTIFWSVMFFFLIALAIGAIAVEIFVWITYGGKPVTEIPSWALVFMFGGK